MLGYSKTSVQIKTAIFKKSKPENIKLFVIIRRIRKKNYGWKNCFFVAKIKNCEMYSD